MPKKFVDYKWVLGTKFSIMDEFKDAIANYVVCNGRDLHFIKNDKTLVKVGCKEGCGYVALCSKFPNEDTWHLRKLNDTHTCNKEFYVRMFNIKWLGKKLYSIVRVNPCVKLTTIREKVHEKYNTGMSRMKDYMERKATLNYGKINRNLKVLYG